MRGIAWWTLAVLAAAPVAGLAQTKAGGEFKVNTYTRLNQQNPSIVASPDGGFVVVWRSDGQDGDGWGVFGQRYDGRGVAQGAEFQVNTYTTDFQGAHAPLGLGIDRRGDFTVAWPSLGQDGSSFGVFGQRFDTGGRRSGGEFLVNTYTTGVQGTYGASMGPAGHFVVVWVDPRGRGRFGIFARRYDPSGVAQGPEFQVNTITTASLYYPSVAVGVDGGFVVTWNSEGPQNAFDLFARRFDASGAGLGAEFSVNSATTYLQYHANVAMAPDGRFVVAWDRTDLFHSTVFARRYDPSGSPLGDGFQVSDRSYLYCYPRVSLDASGRFIVAWSSSQGVGSLTDVFARRFNADGSALGAQFQVNTYTTDLQSYAAVASDPVGNFVIAWHSDQGFALRDVEAQRFGGLQPAALAVDDGATGNGVLEAGDAFTLHTAWRNVNGAAQTFDGTASNLAAPSGLTLDLTPAATYGTVADGAVGPCTTCFAGTLAGTRPAGHHDAAFDEDIAPAAQGQKKRWSLHVGGSFADVPSSNGFYRFVETLLHQGVTAGCGGGNYCPGASTTREQMAVFVLVAREGASPAPPACTTPVFNDVPATSGFCRYIEELFRRGVVTGCGGNSYCPGDPVTREQMAVFTLRTLDGTLSPPACGVPRFDDVPASSPFCRWVEELARRGVVTGCGGNNYCPADPVTREQMGVFISATFGLTLYGP